MRFRNGKVNSALILTLVLFFYLMLDILLHTLSVNVCPISFLDSGLFYRVGFLVVNPVTVPLTLVAGMTQLILGLMRKREDEHEK